MYVCVCELVYVWSDCVHRYVYQAACALSVMLQVPYDVVTTSMSARKLSCGVVPTARSRIAYYDDDNDTHT